MTLETKILNSENVCPKCGSKMSVRKRISTSNQPVEICMCEVCKFYFPLE